VRCEQHKRSHVLCSRHEQYSSRNGPLPQLAGRTLGCAPHTHPSEISKRIPMTDSTELEPTVSTVFAREPSMPTYQEEQQRIRANYERLKAERLAREAAYRCEAMVPIRSARPALW
jgi:hypothetical protein